MSSNPSAHPAPDEARDTLTLAELVSAWTARRRTIATATLAAGIAGTALSLVLTPIFTARAVIVPPQQQGSGSAAAALGSLSLLAGLGATKSPAEQYVSFMTSVTVSDRVIDQFKLMDVYDVKYRADARKMLDKNVTVTVGKKDGLITIEVDDEDPKRAAGIATALVEGLRYMTNTIAVTEAQQRRVFFEQKMRETRDALAKAQIELQASGYNPSAIKAEPTAAASTFARIQTELTSAEVRLHTLRSSLADTAPEVMRQQATVSALQEQVARLEKADAVEGGGQSADYITKFREFKYQGALFEVLARQYEAARVDESREGGLVQVVDPATPPEKRSKPRRVLIALGSALAGLLLSTIWVLPRSARGRR